MQLSSGQISIKHCILTSDTYFNVSMKRYRSLWYLGTYLFEVRCLLREIWYPNCRSIMCLDILNQRRSMWNLLTKLVLSLSKSFHCFLQKCMSTTIIAELSIIDMYVYIHIYIYIYIYIYYVKSVDISSIRVLKTSIK